MRRARNVRSPAQAVASISGDWVLALEPSATRWARRLREEIRKVGENLPFGEMSDRIFGWRRSWVGPRSALSRSTERIGDKEGAKICGPRICATLESAGVQF